MRQPVTNGPDAIRRALSLLVEPGSVVELRIPERGRRGIVSGYYDDLDALAKRADFLSGTVTSVCITLNPVNRALLARAANRTKEYAEATTADTHILSCRWWLIDIDPDRPSGISSTDEEHKLDLDKAQAIVAWLWGRGWTARMLLADSGNGAHVLVRVDLPNSDDARAHEVPSSPVNSVYRCARARGCDHRQRVASDQDVRDASLQGRFHQRAAAPRFRHPRRGW
jgi:hypothetical protein